jgi:hypothetical protein
MFTDMPSVDSSEGPCQRFNTALLAISAMGQYNLEPSQAKKISPVVHSTHNVRRNGPNREARTLKFSEPD